MPPQQVGQATGAAETPVFYVPKPNEPPNIFAAFWSNFLRIRTPDARLLFQQRLAAMDPNARKEALRKAYEAETERMRLANNAAMVQAQSGVSLYKAILDATTDVAIQNSVANIKQMQEAGEFARMGQIRTEDVAEKRRLAGNVVQTEGPKILQMLQAEDEEGATRLAAQVADSIREYRRAAAASTKGTEAAAGDMKGFDAATFDDIMSSNIPAGLKGLIAVEAGVSGGAPQDPQQFNVGVGDVVGQANEQYRQAAEAFGFDPTLVDKMTRRQVSTSQSVPQPAPAQTEDQFLDELTAPPAAPAPQPATPAAPAMQPAPAPQPATPAAPAMQPAVQQAFDLVGETEALDKKSKIGDIGDPIYTKKGKAAQGVEDVSKSGRDLSDFIIGAERAVEKGPATKRERGKALKQGIEETRQEAAGVPASTKAIGAGRSGAQAFSPKETRARAKGPSKAEVEAMSPEQQAMRSIEEFEISSDMSRKPQGLEKFIVGGPAAREKGREVLEPLYMQGDVDLTATTDPRVQRLVGRKKKRKLEDYLLPEEMSAIEQAWSSGG